MLSNHTDHCIDFVQSALDKGSDSAVLFSKKTLSRHLQKVKCQRADIPNPEIPVRIQVQLNQVQELQKVISQLGTIIVDGKAYPPVMSPGPRPQQPSPNLISAVGGRGSLTSPIPDAPVRQQMSQQQAQPTHPQQRMPPPGLSPQLQGPVNNPVGGPFMNNQTTIFNSTSPHQQQNPSQQQNFVGPGGLTRSFSQDGGASGSGTNNFGPFGHNLGPMRQGAPHVSSSTHPQNMGMYLSNPRMVFAFFFYCFSI